MYLILITIVLVCVALLFSKTNNHKSEKVLSHKPKRNSSRFLTSTEVQSGTCDVHTANQIEAKRLMRMLLDIYTPKIPYQLKVSNKKPKTKMGVYYSNGSKIIVYEGWNCASSPEETAIHELAHHIHLTENKGRSRKERPHGKEFKKIYNQLISIARQKGYKV